MTPKGQQTPDIFPRNLPGQVPCTLGRARVRLVSEQCWVWVCRGLSERHLGPLLRVSALFGLVLRQSWRAGLSLLGAALTPSSPCTSPGKRDPAPGSSICAKWWLCPTATAPADLWAQGGLSGHSPHSHYGCCTRSAQRQSARRVQHFFHRASGTLWNSPGEIFGESKSSPGFCRHRLASMHLCVHVLVCAWCVGVNASVYTC